MTLFILVITFILAAVGLAWFLIANDHGEKEPIGTLWLAAGFGLVGAVAAGYIESATVSNIALLPGTALPVLGKATLTIGLVEELCKFLPLAIFLHRKRYFNEHSDGIIYFALAGLGFGVPENILYTVQFGAKAGLARLVLTPLFHAATTAAVGYMLARAKVERRSLLPVGATLLIAILAHALYDFGLASGVPAYATISIATTLLLSVGMFVLYQRASDLDQEAGLSTVGHNNFCRSCGAPNPEHDLYCAQCGINA